MIRLDRMLEEGDIELLDKAGIKTEILNHAPAGSQILPYTPYVAMTEIEIETQNQYVLPKITKCISQHRLFEKTRFFDENSTFHYQSLCPVFQNRAR